MRFTELSEAQLRQWRVLAENTMMTSALGEYTPEEFIVLLDEVERLREELRLERERKP